MGEANLQAIDIAAFNRRKKIITKRVNPDWYKRYMDILPIDERVSMQPLKEIKAEEAIIKAMRTPPKVRDRAEELARKLALERATKVKTVLQLLEGDPDKMKQKLASVKQGQTSALKYLTEGDKDDKKARVKKRKPHSNLQLPEGWCLPPTSKWRLLLTNKIIRKKLQTMAAELRSGKIRARWQKAIRMVRAVVRFTNIIANIARTTGDVFKEFHEVMKKNRMRDEQAGGLYFDRNNYKTSTSGKQFDVESVYTLGKPEIYRTPEEIHKTAVSLRFLRSFAAFPSHFQDMLASIGWFLEVPADKVIIRQGQQAHAFYFLMSGKAVAVRLTGSSYYRAHSGFDVMNVFERDGMFGEEGVIERGYRTYTVTSIEPCTLLSINIDDYNRVCLKAPSEDDNPDHIRLLSQLEFMRHFPMKSLIDDADGNIILFYFKPGAVVTTRLSTSNYIYIIKTGTCRVLCQVARFKPVSFKRKTMKVVVPAKSSTLEASESGDDQEGQAEGDPPEVKVQSPGANQASPETSMTSFMSSRRQSKQVTEEDPDRTMKLMDKLKTQWEREDTIATSIKKMRRQFSGEGMVLQLQRAGSVEKFLSAPATRSKHNKPDLIWVNLKTLREADVIGIEELDLADERDYEHPKVSVVSDGSEVILISRKYFMDNASPKMRAHLRATSFILPDDETLTLELQRLQFWQKFQAKTRLQMAEEKGFG